MKVSLFSMACGFFLAVGFPLAASAGPLPGGADTDGDTVEDAFDNCSADSNSNQNDADHDGCGDACDALLCDLTGDGKQGTPDFIILSGTWLCGPPDTCAGDCTDDGKVGTPDFINLSADWNKSNGPSGITNPSRDTAVCN